MSSTFDTNLLLYASDERSARNAPARDLLDTLAGGAELVYLLWPVALGYLRIATHPSVFDTPLSTEDAMANVETLLRRPAMRTAGETDRFWHAYVEIAQEVLPRGNLVPDTHIVALMREHGIRTIWTHDRDFRSFEGIRVRDPFAAGRP